MISARRGRVQRPLLSAASVHRFGPWPWYLVAADAIGLDVAVVDDIAGDLVEECAGLTGPAGIIKRAWCVGQAVRALPYLALCTLRGGPSRDWLTHAGYLASPRALAKVRQWFRHEDHERDVVAGRSALDKELQRLGATGESHEAIAHETGFPKLEDFYAALGFGRWMEPEDP